MEFQPDSVQAYEIRKDANYSGIRMTLLATLDGGRCHIQADIGFGDAVTPEPQKEEYSTILDNLKAPKLNATFARRLSPLPSGAPLGLPRTASTNQP